MDKKIMAIATVVALIAIIGGIVYAMHKDDGKCDYTLLDSTDNIKEGFTVVYDGMCDGGTLHSKKVVQSVENGRVTFLLTVSNNDEIHYYDLDNFLPGNPIDYVSNIPEGVTVIKEGDTYTIKGTVDQYGYERILDMVIVYDGEHVRHVEGTENLLFIDDGTETLGVSEYTTENGMVKEKYDYGGYETDEVSIKSFMNMIGYVSQKMLDESTVEDGRYGGVDVKIYTFNGSYGGSEYTNYKLYVYNGHALLEEGDLNTHGFEHHDKLEVKVYQA